MSSVAKSPYSVLCPGKTSAVWLEMAASCLAQVYLLNLGHLSCVGVWPMPLQYVAPSWKDRQCDYSKLLTASREDRRFVPEALRPSRCELSSL